jgi:hypothetical protein
MQVVKEMKQIIYFNYNFPLRFSKGDAQDYFVFGLQDGALYFKLNIKGQTFEKALTISGTYLHNNQWHSVKFTRKVRHVSLIFISN